MCKEQANDTERIVSLAKCRGMSCVSKKIALLKNINTDKFIVIDPKDEYERHNHNNPGQVVGAPMGDND